VSSSLCRWQARHRCIEPPGWFFQKLYLKGSVRLTRLRVEKWWCVRVVGWTKLLLLGPGKPDPSPWIPRFNNESIVHAFEVGIWWFKFGQFTLANVSDHVLLMIWWSIWDRCSTIMMESAVLICWGWVSIWQRSLGVGWGFSWQEIWIGGTLMTRITNFCLFVYMFLFVFSP
jgi:hypothetical protein